MFPVDKVTHETQILKAAAFDAVQKFVCKNPNCQPITLPGKTEPSGGRGVVKEFMHWSPVGKQKTPGCIVCGKEMARVK